MKTQTGRGSVIVDAVTAAEPGSDYTSLPTVRITYAAMDVVREVCDPFIGRPNTMSNRNAMDTEIARGLQAMVDAKPQALTRFNFQIKSTDAMQVIGRIEIDLVLRPVFTIRDIYVTVRLTAT